jgi:hypothetical protein
MTVPCDKTFLWLMIIFHDVTTIMERVIWPCNISIWPTFQKLYRYGMAVNRDLSLSEAFVCHKHILFKNQIMWKFCHFLIYFAKRYIVHLTHITCRTQALKSCFILRDFIILGLSLSRKSELQLLSIKWLTEHSILDNWFWGYKCHKWFSNDIFLSSVWLIIQLIVVTFDIRYSLE